MGQPPLPKTRSPSQSATSVSPDGVFVIYRPKLGFVGNDSFTFKVNDGTVDSTAATVTINVAEPVAGQELQGPVVSLVESTATVNEGDGSIELTIQLSEGPVVASTVLYSTSHPPFLEETDANSDDFAWATDQSIEILAGQTSATISIEIIDDSEEELDETFFVRIALSDTGNGIAHLDTNRLTIVTILDNDGSTPDNDGSTYEVYIPIISK